MGVLWSMRSNLVVLYLCAGHEDSDCCNDMDGCQANLDMCICAGGESSWCHRYQSLHWDW